MVNKKNQKKEHVRKKHLLMGSVSLLFGIFLVLLLYLMPPAADLNHTRFMMLSKDVGYVAEQTQEPIDWAAPREKCTYSATNLNPRGSWWCEVAIEGRARDGVDRDTLKEVLEGYMLSTGRFAMSSNGLRHDNSGVTCEILLSGGNSATVNLVCGGVSDKSWYPPGDDPLSQSETLPGAGAWKRADRFE